MSNQGDKRVVDMFAEDLRTVIREETNNIQKLLAIASRIKIGTSDAAEALDTTPKTINAWRKSGKLQHESNGKIPVSEILRLLMGPLA